MVGGWRLGGCALLLALVAPVAGCSRDTPLCDYAAGLVKSGQLAQAADAYASAGSAGEGDCGDDGLNQVGKLRAQISTYNAKGRAAARAGKVPAAQASFRAALAIDHGDATALAEMQRLGAKPAPASTASTVLVSGPPGKDAGQGLAWAALIVALLAAAAGGALWLLHRRREYDRRIDAVRKDAEAQRQRVAELERELSGQVSGVDEALSGRIEREAQDARRRADQVSGEVEELRGEMLRLARAGRQSGADVDEWYAGVEEQ
ncbi:hypothetical protein [Paractinoplanes globisporus]|uniref:Tetratricopeptide repeat protein n=1 Tax=Paractinoplanes globisporus TaxID=113565 RepID=A0ABW6WLI0_9ACTN|nr:hypothetical protein [Actinoplanes globisporus]